MLSEAIARYMQNGGYNRHLRSLRRIYQTQIDAVRGLIGKHFAPGTGAIQPDGGFVLWVELPEPIHPPDSSVRHLRKEWSLCQMPGELYSDDPRFAKSMRIACCQELNESFIRAIEVLGALARQELHG